MEQGKLMSRQEATDYLLAAKKAKGLTFEEISKAVGRDKVWVTAAIMGQATMSKDEAEKTVKTLGVGEGLAGQIADSLQEMPMKGSLDASVPVDPLIYRFHEITQVYGTTMKALIHENVRRRHHERHRFRDRHSEKTRSEGRPGRRYI
jgi:cyanate lyase